MPTWAATRGRASSTSEGALCLSLSVSVCLCLSFCLGLSVSVWACMLCVEYFFAAAQSCCPSLPVSPLCYSCGTQPLRFTARYFEERMRRFVKPLCGAKRIGKREYLQEFASVLL